MWQSAIDLMDWAGVVSRTTSSPDNLRSIGTPAMPDPPEPEREYGNPRLQTAEHIVPWCNLIPETVGHEKDMRKTCMEWSVQEHQCERRNAA